MLPARAHHHRGHVCEKLFVPARAPEFGGNSAAGGEAAGLHSRCEHRHRSHAFLALQLKFGKFKSPVGLELLQSDSWTFFNERSIVTNLVPNRDLGVQAAGDVFGNTLNYTVRVFNGVPDAANSGNAGLRQRGTWWAG